MEKIKILLIEDEDNGIDLFNDAKRNFETQNSNYKIELSIEKNISQSLYESLLRGDFSFLITDLRVPNNGDGNKIITDIKKTQYTPIFIATGNKSDLIDNIETIFYKIYDKGDTRYDNIYEEILKEIKNIYDTGFTKILGNNGRLNELIKTFLGNGGVDNLSEWLKFNNIDKSEKSLSRYILSHLHHNLSGDYEDFHSEEIYLKVTNISTSDLSQINSIKEDISKIKDLKNILKKYYNTGTIIQKDGKYYTIMNPACDISNSKQEKFLLSEIDKMNTELLTIKDKKNKMDAAKVKYGNNNSPENKKDLEEKSTSYDRYYKDIFLKQNYKNIFTLYPSSLFEGGYVNFRKLYRVEIKDIIDYIPNFQISNLFLKDLISEFGYYYSRQGQPNLNDDIII